VTAESLTRRRASRRRDRSAGAFALRASGVAPEQDTRSAVRLTV